MPSFDPLNNDLMIYIKKKKKKKKKKKRREKNKLSQEDKYRTPKTDIVGYTDNIIMVFSYLTFASSPILLRRGN